MPVLLLSQYGRAGGDQRGLARRKTATEQRRAKSRAKLSKAKWNETNVTAYLTACKPELSAFLRDFAAHDESLATATFVQLLLQALATRLPVGVAARVWVLLEEGRATQRA